MKPSAEDYDTTCPDTAHCCEPDKPETRKQAGGSLGSDHEEEIVTDGEDGLQDFW